MSEPAKAESERTDAERIDDFKKPFEDGPGNWRKMIFVEQGGGLPGYWQSVHADFELS